MTNNHHHFGSRTDIKTFLSTLPDSERQTLQAEEPYEAATILVEDYSLCPWNITEHVESQVPVTELSGTDPRDMLRHEAVLCLEQLINDEFH